MRRHKSPNTIVGHDNKPPLRAKRSVKNSHTSPRKIALMRKMNEALALRAQGLTFRQIARKMHTSTAVAHGRVVRALNAVPLENARQVLALELQRLDAYLAKYHTDAILGDLHAAELALKISAHRSRLLGIIPTAGQQAQVLIQAQAGEMQVPAIEFIVPGFGPPRDPVDVPAPEPERRPERLLPPPREKYPTPFGTIELEAEPPRQGPRTELDPGAPRPQGGGGESRLWGRSSKGTDWMGS
jgi:hypothetical protein